MYTSERSYTSFTNLMASSDVQMPHHYCVHYFAY